MFDLFHIFDRSTNTTEPTASVTLVTSPVPILSSATTERVQVVTTVPHPSLSPGVTSTISETITITFNSTISTSFVTFTETLSPTSSPTSTTKSILTTPDTTSATAVSTTSTRSSSTSRTSSQTPTHSPSKNSSSISSGAAAGIGIGSAIAGAVLALIGFWLFMKLKKTPPKRKTQLSANRGLEDFEEPKVPIATSIAPVSLERTDISHIRKSMQDLNELINQHVENHYHSEIYNGAQATLESGLLRAGYSEGTNLTAKNMASLLLSRRSRPIAIRRLIAEIIMRNIELKSISDTTLLPATILSFCQAIYNVERSPMAAKAFPESFARWRHLSGYLLDPTHHHEGLKHDESVHEPVIRNIQTINSVLEPFIKPGAENLARQEDNLGSVILEGANLGLLLFSQPMAWEFGWDLPRAANGKTAKCVVVAPAVMESVLNVSSRPQIRILVNPVVEEI